MTNEGMRYSNIDPDQDLRPGVTPTDKKARPSAIQWRRGTSPLAIAKKLDSRDSDASRS